MKSEECYFHKDIYLFHRDLCNDFTAAAAVGGVNNKIKTIECIRLVGIDKRHISGGVHGGVTGVTSLSPDKLASVGNDHAVVTWNIPSSALK
jgi:hypothetical protein